MRRLNWNSFRQLRTEAITVDLHCVTRWSKLGTSWEGVSLDAMFAEITTDADYALVHSYGDDSTNLPLRDLLNQQAWIAFRFDGEDLAPAVGQCAHWRAAKRIAQARVYTWKVPASWCTDAVCEGILLRLADIRERVFLDVPGLTYLRLDTLQAGEPS